MAPSPWAKFSLPGSEPAYARGDSPEFRKTLRQIFGPLVEPVSRWPDGRHPWLLAEVPADGSLSAFFREIEKRLVASGSLWVGFPKKPLLEELDFPYTRIHVQQARMHSRHTERAFRRARALHVRPIRQCVKCGWPLEGRDGGARFARDPLRAGGRGAGRRRARDGSGSLRRRSDGRAPLPPGDRDPSGG